VPRNDLGRIEGRLRSIEQTIRDAEQDRWTRSNPQARARAEDAVTQLETTIENLRRRLEKARTAGDARAATDAEQALQAREEWLAQARRALADFGG
jgi:molecular chaperone DnaK (HSP70)